MQRQALQLTQPISRDQPGIHDDYHPGQLSEACLGENVLFTEENCISLNLYFNNSCPVDACYLPAEYDLASLDAIYLWTLMVLPDIPQSLDSLWLVSADIESSQSCNVHETCNQNRSIYLKAEVYSQTALGHQRILKLNHQTESPKGNFQLSDQTQKIPI